MVFLKYFLVCLFSLPLLSPMKQEVEPAVVAEFLLFRDETGAIELYVKYDPSAFKSDCEAFFTLGAFQSRVCDEREFMELLYGIESDTTLKPMKL